jgi:hypothetical protein
MPFSKICISVSANKWSIETFISTRIFRINIHKSLAKHLLAYVVKPRRLETQIKLHYQHRKLHL